MRFRPRSLVAAIALPIAICACSSDAPEPAEEPELGDTGSDITGPEIEEAVPGVEAAAPEGETPNTAGFEDGENAEYAEPDDPEEERP
ncbi:hypothetical protein [Qipengyuania qiaonensis]|uniref:Uncharacterized protein n=1 Tax=Qipengyuania qiaonensis TaxID=2867240 RepID=A0ABS7J3M9_9SPHN|nr:hypothetical protein [Qipengyuania qiaonensis]MBX7481931.1 hypothetical protein [Qipengyuania qiaonensis]